MSDLTIEQHRNGPVMGIRTHFSSLWDSDDILDSIWRVFASPYTTMLLLIGLAALVCIGILLPQRPPEAIADPMTNGLWLTSLRERYHGAADWLVRSGLVDVHRSLWFRALLGLLALNLVLKVVDFFQPFHLRSVDCSSDTRTFVGDAAPSQSREQLLGRLKEVLRAQRYRLVEGKGNRWIYADRFAYFPLVVYVGLLLIIGGLALSERTAWWEEGITLRPGQVRLLGHGMDLTFRAETVEASHPRTEGRSLNGRTELTFLRAGREVGREVLHDHVPSFYAGLAFHQTATEPALLVEAHDGTGRALALQTPDTGATQFVEVSLRFREEESPRYIVMLDLTRGSRLSRSFQQAGNEQYVLVPSRELSLRLVYHSLLPGEAAPTFQVEAFHGAETTPFWQRQFQEAISVEIAGDTYTLKPQRFAVIKYGRDYGVPLIAVGAGIALAGIALSAWRPPRRLWLAMQLVDSKVDIHFMRDDSAARGTSLWFEGLVQDVATALGLTASSASQ